MLITQRFIGKMNESISDLVQDTQLSEIYDALQKEISDRKNDMGTLKVRMDSSLSGLEESLSEFEHISKKFKREKSDIMIVKDSLKNDFEKANQKLESSNIAIIDLSRFCLNVAEFLKITHEFRNHENINKNGLNSQFQLLGGNKRLPPINSDFNNFSMTKK
jgi:SepF-like predicted cell division protein (DUF552 family)